MGEKEDDIVEQTIHKWLGRMVVLGIPFVFVGAIGIWATVRDLSGSMARAESRLTILEDFRLQGGRWTKGDAREQQAGNDKLQARNERRFDVIESDIDILDKRVDGVHDAQQEHRASAAGWIAQIKQNTRDIEVLKR